MLAEFEPIRNKVLAHADYKVVVDGYQGISKASRSQIDDTLRNLEELVNLIRLASGLMPISNDFAETQIEGVMSDFFEAINITDGMGTDDKVI